MKKRFTTFLIFTSIFLSAVCFLPQNVKAEININSEYQITSDSTYIFEVFNLREDIVISDNINVEFYGCRFNFLNESEGNGIIGGNNANITFERCEFYGLDSDPDGNSYLEFPYPNKITILGSDFIDIGYSDNIESAISVEGSIFNDVQLTIKDSTYVGHKGFLYSNYMNKTVIKDCSIESEQTEGIALRTEYGNNLLFDACNISTLATGVLITNGLANHTIQNSKIESTSKFGISICMKNNTPNAVPSKILNNTFIGYSCGLEVEASPDIVIHNNTFYQGMYSLRIQSIDPELDSNKTISHNTFKNPNIIKPSSKFMQWQGGSINYTLTNNSFYINESLDIECQILSLEHNKIVDNIVTDNSNHLNGEIYYIFAGEQNSSKTYDFSDVANTAGITIHSVNNTIFKNINIINLTTIDIHHSNNITIDNLRALNPRSDNWINHCSNITIQNSTIRSLYADNEAAFYINASNNVLFNNSLFEMNSDELATAGLYFYGDNNNTTIMNCTILGMINFALRMTNTNNSFVINNTIDVKYHSLYLLDCLYNNFTENTFIRKDFGHDLNILALQDVFAYENNSYNHNHWSNYINSTDHNEDGICDEPFTMDFTVPDGEVTDPLPIFIDRDSDGLDDLHERYYGTDPDSADSDEDLLSDYEEIRLHNTNPNDMDTDNDLVNDYEEIMAGSDGYITNPLEADTDGDLFPDETEIDGGTDPTDPSDYPGGYYNDQNTETEESQETSKDKSYWVPGQEYYLPTTISIVAIVVIFGEIRGWLKNRKKNIRTPKEEI